MATSNKNSTKKVTSNSDRITNLPKQQVDSESNAIFSIFEQGPKDIIGRVDAYGNQIKEIGTKLNNTMSKWVDDAFAQFKVTNKKWGGFDLGGISDKFSGLTDKVKGAVKYLEQTKEEIDKRCQSLLGRDLKSLTNLPGELKRDMVGTIANLTGGWNVGNYNVGNLVREGKLTYDQAKNAYQIVRNGDWTSLAGIQQGLNLLGGNRINDLLKPMIDFQATSAFVGALAAKAVDLGIPDLVHKVCSHFDSNGIGKGEKGRYLQVGVYNAAIRSDLSMIDALVEQLGGDNLYSKNPKIIEWILTNYENDQLYTPEHLLDYRKKLIQTLERLDSNWDTEIRNNVPVTRLSVFRNASKDARTLLSYEVPNEKNYRTEIMIATNYAEKDLKMLVLSQFKDITFKNRPTDPRKRM